MTIDFDVSQAEWSRTMPEWHQYMTALFHDLIWWRGRQLTTGHDATCPARYSDESECAGAGDGFCADVIDCTCKLIDSGTQFAHWTDPYCRMHGEPLRSRPVATYNKPPACTCRYGLHPTIWSPTHRVDVPGVGMRGAAYTFRIDRRCPHHGDVRRADVVIDWCEQNGVHLFAWQRDAIRAAYTGQMVQRSGRTGMTTVLRALEAYGERVPIMLDEAGAWLVLDDAERRGD
jgi:hypothetical protein